MSIEKRKKYKLSKTKSIYNISLLKRSTSSFKSSGKGKGKIMSLYSST
jgi:hypothetical protein